MGNNQSLQLLESDMATTLTEQMRNQISIVDHAVTGLARAIDTMQINCRLLVEHREGTYENKNAEQMLQKLQDVVLDNKSIMVSSVTNFLNFVIENFKRFNDDGLNTCLPLEVSIYIQEIQGKPIQQNMMKEYFIKRIDALKIDAALLQRQNELMNQELKELRNRLQTYIKEQHDEQNQDANKCCEALEPSAESLDFSKLGFTDGAQNDVIGADLRQTELERKHKVELLCKQQIESYKIVNEQCTILPNKSMEEITEMEKSLSKYESKIEKGKDNCILSADISSNIEPLDTKSAVSTDDLQREIQNLEEKYKLEKDYRLKAEAELESLSKSITKKGNLEKEIKTMEEKLENIKRKQKVTVQTYVHSTFNAGHVKNTLLNRLTTLLAEKNTDLEIRVCAKPCDVVADVILVASVNHAKGTRKNKTIENFLKECSDASRKMAILVYHNQNELETQKEVDDFVKAYGSLNSIYHVGHTNTLSSSRLNTSTVNRLTDFILEQGRPKAYFDHLPVEDRS